MINWIGTLRWIYARVNQIFALVNAILMTTETGGTITTDGTQQNVYINNAPAGIFEPKKVMIDLSAMGVGNTVVIRTFYRIKTGGVLRQKDQVVFEGVQALPLKNVELEPNRFGIQVTLEVTQGSQIDVDWEAIYRA